MQPAPRRRTLSLSTVPMATPPRLRRTRSLGASDAHLCVCAEVRTHSYFGSGQEREQLPTPLPNNWAATVVCATAAAALASHGIIPRHPFLEINCIKGERPCRVEGQQEGRARGERPQKEKLLTRFSRRTASCAAANLCSSCGPSQIGMDSVGLTAGRAAATLRTRLSSQTSVLGGAARLTHSLSNRVRTARVTPFHVAEVSNSVTGRGLTIDQRLTMQSIRAERRAFDVSLATKAHQTKSQAGLQWRNHNTQAKRETDHYIG